MLDLIAGVAKDVTGSLVILGLLLLCVYSTYWIIVSAIRIVRLVFGRRG